MTETEYLRVTNRVKVSLALAILRDVQPGPQNGIRVDELQEITARLGDAEEKLFVAVRSSRQQTPPRSRTPRKKK